MKSAYMLHLETQMRPLVDELEELDGLESPSDTETARLEEVIGQIKTMKAEYTRATERSSNAAGVRGEYQALLDVPEGARARTDRPASETRDLLASKGWFDLLVESKAFKHPPNDFYNVREVMPVGKLYPYMERKAPFIPVNMDRSAGADVYSATSPRARHTLLELIRTVQRNDFNINYLPLVFTNNATDVALGAAKPESTNAGTIQTITMTTIAHWKETPRQVLRYIPALRGEIEIEMTEGVLAVAEARVLNGTGVAPQMKGILAQVTNTATGDDLVTQIFDAIGRIESAGGVVDAILVNPGDYAYLIQQEWANNQFNPLIQNDRFGTYRIVKNAQIAAGTALVGDWAMAVVFYVGESAHVDVSEALGLKNNLVTFRGEMDGVVLVTRPWLMYKCPGPLVDVTP